MAGSNTGRPNLKGGRQSSFRGSGAITALPVIEEDGDAPPVPAIPPKAENRPHSRRFGHGDPPRSSFDSPPPSYSVWSSVIGPKGEKFSDVRDNKYLRTSGGRKKIYMIAAIIIALAVGLGVGLGLGLRKKHHSSSATTPSTPSPYPQNQTFPAGTYSIVTFLDTVDTACTSNPSTWLCYPYSTYNQSSTASMTTFEWIIRPDDADSSNFTVSSTDNPFAITFTNASLHLVNEGMTTEAYTFEVSMEKTVVPSTPITSDDSAASCIYNTTMFQAYLYTKTPKTYPPSGINTSNAGGANTFQPWPYAVTIKQSAQGGVNVPQCYKTVNGNLASPITEGFAAQSSQESCSCSYQNFGP